MQAIESVPEAPGLPAYMSHISRADVARAGSTSTKRKPLNAIRSGEFPEVPEGGAVWVFALGD